VHIHAHIHAVMIFDGPVSQELSEELGHRMFTRWARTLGRKGLAAVEDSGGLDVRSVRMHADSLERVGEYIAKVGVRDHLTVYKGRPPRQPCPERRT
jgi:hypothetical protein